MEEQKFEFTSSELKKFKKKFKNNPDWNYKSGQKNWIVITKDPAILAHIKYNLHKTKLEE